MLASAFVLVTLQVLIQLGHAEITVDGPLEKLSWMIGKWKSDFGGKIVWPTVPKMTYGEVLTIGPSESSYEAGISFLNYSSFSWSHSTKDHFLDMYGFITVDEDNHAQFLATGNNGFTTYETGKLDGRRLELDLENIGRITIAREIPVENTKRIFTRVSDDYMEQVILMKTTEHPRGNGLLEHARVLYEKVRE